MMARTTMIGATIAAILCDLCGAKLPLRDPVDGLARAAGLVVLVVMVDAPGLFGLVELSYCISCMYSLSSAFKGQTL